MIQMTEGPFVQITNFVIVASNFVAMLVRYGKTIASVLTTPCIETYTTYGIILEPFVLQPLPLQRIPGCTLANQCCYTVPFEVFGNSPFDTGSGETIVNMDNNLTNPCYGTPACSYARLWFLLPWLSVVDCAWGQRHTFTAQTPTSLVNSRTLPYYVNSTHTIPATPYTLILTDVLLHLFIQSPETESVPFH